MSTEALRTEFIHEGFLILNPEREFKLIGKDGRIRLEVGMLEKEVDYDQFDELLEIRKARFQTAHVKTVNIQNVDFNRLAPDRVEQLLDGCEMGNIKFDFTREHYNQDVFAFIQRIESRAELHLSMRDFILSREELLSLKPRGDLKTYGTIDIAIDDELLIALVTNEHSLSVEVNLTAPETIRDAFKLISNNETEQVVMFSVSDDLFNQFLHLIGARMIDDEIVMENDSEGFSVSNDNGVDVCIGDYTIFFEYTSGIIFRDFGLSKEWILTLAKMKKMIDDESEEESESEEEGDDSDED